MEDIPRAEPMLMAERANVENCILTLFDLKNRLFLMNVLFENIKCSVVGNHYLGEF